MNALELLTGPVAQAIGWALLHLLWQATIVAGILAAVLALMPRQSANARYIVSCGALALVFAMFVATAVRAWDPAVQSISAADPASPETIELSLRQLPALLAETAATSLRDRAIAAVTSARTSLPAIVAIWLAGVILLSSRLLVSWLRARKLVRQGARPSTPEWQDVASRLSAALGLRRVVTLLESAAVEVPSVIGSLRPVVLLPASALTGLTPEQIEMVLAHELAHIRRHDFLVNLLQAVVETLMFFHPAVWWMSRRVRIERENCCDDLAVAVCGNPLQYARALTRLEELRAADLPVLVAANGGSLLDRIRRIAAGRAEVTTASSRWAAAVAMLAILVVVVAVPSLPALAQREKQQKTEAPKAEAAGAKIDVIEDEHDEEGSDLDIDLDHDFDLDLDIDTDVDLSDLDLEPAIAPIPPVAVSFPAHAIAPMAVAVADPVPAIAPMPPMAIRGSVPAPAAVPAIQGVPPAPMAPRAPIRHLAELSEFEFEYEFETDDDGDRRDRPVGSGDKLTVDEIIALRSVEVTPQYLDTMKETFPGLTYGQVTGLKAVGVTPEYIREMRAAGLEVKRARDATSLKAVGVTPEFVTKMRSAGFPVATAKEATSLQAVGVTPEYVAQMRNAGFAITTAKEAATMKAVGVTAEYLREMREAGFTPTAKEIASMRAVGVTGDWVRAMKAAGVAIVKAKDATNLRAVGVTPELVRKLAAAGYTNLSVRELARLAAMGVDDDFIRDLEQYRKK